MYAVVEYDDYRKDQSFEVIITSDDVDYAKKLAFQYAVNDIKHVSRYANDSIYRITTEVENNYLRPINKTIISYKVIEVEKYKKRYKIKSSFSTTYAVIEVKKDIEIENIQEIDTTLICDEYYNYDGEGYYNEDDQEE
jgi:hypothetical protein